MLLAEDFTTWCGTKKQRVPVSDKPKKLALADMTYLSMNSRGIFSVA